MSYHIMYTTMKAGSRYVRVMDFAKGQMIDLTLDEIKDIEEPQLVKLLEENREEILLGRRDYRPNPKHLK